MERPKINQIYCDLDGVLVDFESRFKQYSNGVPAKEYKELYGEEIFWDLIHEQGVGFWVGIPWLPQGKKLWSYIKKYNPIILSAPSPDETSKIGRNIWLKSNLPGVKMILKPSSLKHEYASSTSLLIDDYWKNIRSWENVGGIGIIFKNCNQVIRQLKKMGI